jgi:hypothetical protein
LQGANEYTHPVIDGVAEFDHAVARGGKKAKEDYRCVMAYVMYGIRLIE